MFPVSFDSHMQLKEIIDDSKKISSALSFCFLEDLHANGKIKTCQIWLNYIKKIQIKETLYFRSIYYRRKRKLIKLVNLT